MSPNVNGSPVIGLLAIRVGLRDDARSAALGLGHDLVGVGFGFVDGALLILLRGGDVAIGGNDLARRIDRLQLDLLDEDARAVIVEHVLDALLRVRLDRCAVGRQDAVDGLEANDFPHDALGHRFHRLARA